MFGSQPGRGSCPLWHHRELCFSAHTFLKRKKAKYSVVQWWFGDVISLEKHCFFLGFFSSKNVTYVPEDSGESARLPGYPGYTRTECWTCLKCGGTPVWLGNCTFYFRTPWKCAPERMSLRAFCSPCATSTPWWQRGGSSVLRAGTDRTPLTQGTSPFLSMSSTTTWRPILR